MGMTRYYVDSFGVYLGGFDGATPPPGSIEVSAPPVNGSMIWNGSAWEKLLADAKVDKCAAVDALYLGQYATCTHLGFTWQADAFSEGAIVAKHHVLETSVGGLPPAFTTWTDASNVKHVLTWADFDSLKNRIFTWHEAALENKTDHKNAINALGIVATVEAYDISTGWPA